MDNFNWLVMEMMAVEDVRTRLSAEPPRTEPKAPERAGGARHALASYLVRLGLRLHPAAGEGLGRIELPVAQRRVRSRA